LQTQIAVLQQQVADLTRLHEQHGPEPAIPLAPSQQSRTTKRPKKPIPLAPRCLCPSQNASQADSCLTSRRVWAGGTLHSDLSQAWLAPA
jgi:hypothetical protein